MRQIPLLTDKIYHVCNKSTEGLEIFKRSSLAGRFAKTLYECNSTGDGARGFLRHPRKLENQRHEYLVEVYAVTIMPNHFHLLVKQLVDDGISRWMHRSCNSFARTFNLIYDRKGTLFMGRFRATPVLEDSQLFHLLVYIHANPLDLISKNWRIGHIGNWNKAKSFLAKYQWSSLGLYNDGFEVAKRIRDLVNTAEIKDAMAEWGNVERGIKNWSERALEDIEGVILE